MDKQNAIKLLDETFNHDFDIQRFAMFVKELFNDFCITQKNLAVWNEYQDYIDSYISLGSYTDNSKKVIDVLVVKLKRTSSRDRARTMQRNFIAKYLSNAEKDAALVAFYGDDEDWRFSFVKMEYNLVKDESGKVQISKELTPAKRYSFLVGVNEPNHTCRRQFLKLVMEEGINPSLPEIELAFSIDTVTKEFFLEYKELFLKLEESLQSMIENNPRVKAEFEQKNISTVDFAKKLLGQIVFIYFLQKKGWLGVEIGKDWGTGPKDFMRHLFGDESRGKRPLVPYNNFFNDILEPLFYEALSNDRSIDSHFYSRFDCKIPFLNGGLFEPINDYDWTGAEILLDNSIFYKILSTFDRFNFTVKEDEPLEKEVAVDPEMLGKVFENLLEVKDRKSKGAFYTPREIVHYMCQQSLINYLETNTSIPRKDIEIFIQVGDFANTEDMRHLQEIKRLNEEIISHRGIDIQKIQKDIQDHISKLTLPKSIVTDKEKIDNLLANIKIVDPAVGSGAFLVGMMNEIIKARDILSVYYLPEEQQKRISYGLKRETVESCLYGVDIESSAIDITKLRLWLSLIVDELDMKNIKPLPNLDYKIMCGNSLLEEFEGIKLFDEKLLIEVPKDNSFEVDQIDKEMKQLYQEFGEIHTGKKKDDGRTKEIQRELNKLDVKKQKIISGPKEKAQQFTLTDALQKRIKESQRKLKELRQLHKDYFNEQNRTRKIRLRNDIDRIEWELIEETLKEQDNDAAIEKMAQYKKNKSKPFFLWKLYFAEVFQRENPGFDVVIGNPPYVQLQKMREELTRLYMNANFQVFIPTGDIYMLFYEKGFELLRLCGTLTFITSSQWTKAAYGRPLRRYLLSNNPQQLILLGPGIFETATVDTNILIAEKKSNLNEIKGVVVEDIDQIAQKISNGWIHMKSISDDKWILLNEDKEKIRDKIETKSKPLKEWDLKINFGIKTGRNEAFILDEDKRLELIQLDSKSEEIIGPLLRGRDIGLYLSNHTGLYVILAGFNSHKYIKDKYPAIFLHLISYEKVLKERGQCQYGKKKGITSEEDYPGQHHWLELDNNPSKAYLELFKKEKLVWKRIGSQIRFSYSDKEIYCLDSTCIATGEKIKFLTAYLNSKLGKYQLFEASPRTGMGDLILSVQALEPLYVHHPTAVEEKSFTQLLDQILSITKDSDYIENPDKQAKVKQLEKEIDALVYKLYELTPEEIKIVEGFNEGK